MTAFHRLPCRPFPGNRVRRTLGALVIASALLPVLTQAGEAMTCELTFAASDWSQHYRAARGTGELRCADGRSLPVRVSVKGGDQALKIASGAASFSGVRDPRDVIGAYAAEGDAVGPHRLMRKGAVQLQVTATGEWWQQGGRPDSLVIATR